MQDRFCRKLFRLYSICAGTYTYGSADTQHFVSREKFTRQLLQRTTISMEQNVVERGRFFFIVNVSRIESVSYRNFPQNWIKSILNDTYVKIRERVWNVI